MKKTTKLIVIAVCVIGALMVLGIYGLFHGYFDHGRFEIKQAQWSSSKRVAMLAERSDHEALGGLTYFVLLGNHLYSPDELRHAYYSNDVVFAAASDCLNLHWESPNELVVGCKGPSVPAEQIDVQKRQSQGVAILYKNISRKHIGDRN